MTSTKKKDVPFWKTGRTGGKSPNGSRLPHVELYADLLQDPAFAGLTGSAYKTYIGMMKERGRQSENFAFAFPRRVAEKYGVSEDSLRRAVKDLEQKGFIKCCAHNSNLRKADLYQFSIEWKQREPP